jgi:hypothetical protein|tara:strand:+ start:267 stop:461 length:195 start_codon:yes stop_codon:yes gene_type:complete
MFIELEEIISSGITAGKKRPIAVNTEKISSLTPVDHKGHGTQISLRRGTIQVTESYEEILRKLN